MALITKEVTVKWNANNIKWYQSKGYIFTKNNDEFIVKSIDLPLTSRVKIEIQCDYCVNIISRNYIDYIDGQKAIQKDACKKCKPLKTKDAMIAKYGNDYTKEFSHPSNNKISLEVIIKAFNDNGYELLTSEYINNRQKLSYICKKHPNKIRKITYFSIQQGHGCRECANEHMSSCLSGDKSYLWKGGISKINTYFRQCLTQWKIESMRNDNYKCVICDDKFYQIHHRYGFDLILLESLAECGLSIFPTMGDYSEDEIEAITNKILEKHDKYGLGSCMCKEHHDLFHCQYGRGSNTPEQFEEFKARWKAGEFNVNH